MAGSGKSEAVKYLQKKHKWPNVYLGQATFDRMKDEGLALNYNNERKVREKIRRELGMGAYAILALSKIKDKLKHSQVVLAESLYSWDEYKILKKEFKDKFRVIAIYASPTIRFKRLGSRKKERPIKNRLEFKTRDYTELENLAKGAPIAMADYTIINETNINWVHQELDKIIDDIFHTP